MPLYQVKESRWGGVGKRLWERFLKIAEDSLRMMNYLSIKFQLLAGTEPINAHAHAPTTTTQASWE